MSAEFPFVGTVQALNTSTLPLFYMYDWDFKNNCFTYDGNGKQILLSGNEALKIWILKALKTERFFYLAYSWRYGSELKKYIGQVMGVGERKSEMKRAIVECLMVNPYVKSVNSVEFIETEHRRDMEIKISVTTIYGNLTL